jgi:hypothetical protein
MNRGCRIVPEQNTAHHVVLVQPYNPAEGFYEHHDHCGYAREGSRAGGPIGGVVGGAVGAVTGTIGGILGVDERPRFHEYVVRERRPSYAYRGEFRVGTVLPDEEISYYDVPAEYRAPGYRYTILNGHTVLIDPRTRRIVEILD